MKIGQITICGLLILSACKLPYQFTVLSPELELNSTKTLDNKVLSIEIFEDVRSEDIENDIYFNKARRIKKEGGEDVCINSEPHYESLPYQLSKLTASFIKRTKKFKNVVYGKKHLSDYYITAKLKNYKAFQYYAGIGRGGFSNTLNIQIGSVSVGLPLSKERRATVYSNGEVLIELEEVKLFAKNDSLISQIGLIETSYEGGLPADAECWCAFWAAEDSYPELVEKLLDEILIELEKYESKEIE